MGLPCHDSGASLAMSDRTLSGLDRSAVRATIFSSPAWAASCRRAAWSFSGLLPTTTTAPALLGNHWCRVEPDAARSANEERLRPSDCAIFMRMLFALQTN